MLTLKSAALRPPEEHAAVHARGYLKGVGMLMWVYCRTCPILSHVMTNLTRIMSMPTEEGWDALMWAISFTYKIRHEGITYRSDGNQDLRTYYDTSDNPDPRDGKA